MPEAKKTSWAQLRVGVMAFVAMLILAVLIFLLTGRKNPFSHNVALFTFMDDSGGMADNSPVRLNGILAGSIDKIELSGSADPRRAVKIEMSIRGEYLREIPEDSICTISASNLLGDKFLNISKGKSSRQVRPGGELRSLEPKDIEGLLTQSSALLGSLQAIIGRFDSLLKGIESGQGNVGKFLKDEELYGRMNGLVAEIQKTAQVLNSKKGTLGRLLNDETLYEEVRVPIKRLDNVLASVQQGQGTAGKLLRDQGLYDDARKSIGDIRGLIGELNAGKGTAGKFLKDEQLYREMNQLIAKLDTTIDKMNSGQGTLGQLLANPQLYETMNGATRELQSLFKDIRANPKKFLRIKLALF